MEIALASRRGERRKRRSQNLSAPIACSCCSWKQSFLKQSVCRVLGGLKGSANPARSLELEVWHDLAFVCINLSWWRDAEICLSKSEAVCSYSGTRGHVTGVFKEAIKAFRSALSTDPTYAPSLMSTVNGRSNAVIGSFLMTALRLDRMNSFAWSNLGLLYYTSPQMF